MKRIIRFPIILAIKSVFHLLDTIVPKDPKIIILASKSGKINSNVLELWKRMKTRTDLLPYLSTDACSDSYHIDILSLKGFWLVLRAKFVFLTHGPGDIKYAWFSKQKIVTYIGHGVPLKGFIFTNKNLNAYESFFHRLEIPGYSYVIASSEADKVSLIKCLDKPKDQVLVTGLPRNDILLRDEHELNSYFSGYKKRILYAPTHRDFGQSAFFPFADKNIEKLNEFLKSNNYLLVLRGHVNNDNSVFNFDDYSNIKQLDSLIVPEIQTVLAGFDLLVTDYSSIYIDFLLTLKPLIFIPYDLNEYIECRGMMHEYCEVSPGPHIFTQSQFISELDKMLNDSSLLLDERLRVRDYFHKYRENLSDRVIKEVIFRANLQ